MDSLQLELLESVHSSSAGNKMSTPITAEETAPHEWPDSMVIGASEPPGPSQQVLLTAPKAPVVSDGVFHCLQKNFGALAVDAECVPEQELLAATPSEPFRRLHDSTVEQAPPISHIGVFVNVKGDGAEEEAKHKNDQPNRLEAECSSNPYQYEDLNSPVVPLPECGVKEQQVLVGGAGGNTPHPLDKPRLLEDSNVVSYSQECTEDVDGCSNYYQLGKHWEKGDLIGRGAVGTCFIAVDMATKHRMVVKQISRTPSLNYADVLSEVEAMQGVRHENIVQFYGATRDYTHVNLFMEWMKGGSLEARLRNGAFREDVIVHYCRQLVSGLSYLHRKGILHRDLKCGNLLTDSKGFCLKIADFGAATRLTRHTKFDKLVGTAPYLAPEVVRAHKYSVKSDVWSLGCVVIEMATTRPPWVLKNHRHNRLEILFTIGRSETPPPCPRFRRDDLRELTVQCLRLDPADRPSTEDLLLIV